MWDIKDLLYKWILKFNSSTPPVCVISHNWGRTRSHEDMETQRGTLRREEKENDGVKQVRVSLGWLMSLHKAACREGCVRIIIIIDSSVSSGTVSHFNSLSTNMACPDNPCAGRFLTWRFLWAVQLKFCSSCCFVCCVHSKQKCSWAFILHECLCQRALFQKNTHQWKKSKA